MSITVSYHDDVYDFVDVELEMCPHCGGRPEIKQINGDPCICCTECNATMLSNYTPIPDLITMWNRKVGRTNTTSIVYDDNMHYICSNCNHMIDDYLGGDCDIDIDDFQYCPHCGAEIVKTKLIEPCPFCGHIPSVRCSSVGDGVYRYHVDCKGFGCICNPKTSMYTTITHAVDAWNGALNGKK